MNEALAKVLGKNAGCLLQFSRRGGMRCQTSGRCSACLHDLSTKCQKRPHRLTRLCWKEACADRIFALSVIMLREGLDMLPLAMRGIVVSMDSAIHMLTVPMMGKSALLDL
jgi:hypothetical protein